MAWHARGPSRKAPRSQASRRLDHRPGVVGSWVKSRSQIPDHPTQISNPSAPTVFQARSSMRISQATTSNSRSSEVSGGRWCYPSTGAGARRKRVREAGNLHCCTDARKHPQEYHFVPHVEVRNWAFKAQCAICKPNRHQSIGEDACVFQRFKNRVGLLTPKMRLRNEALFTMTGDRAEDGDRRGRPSAPAAAAGLRGSSTVGVVGMPTRNARILLSFGNWIAACADHSCGGGIRRRMPAFQPSSGSFKH